MKCSLYGTIVDIWESHPARGAWIEIDLLQAGNYITRRRTPQGVRGLKFVDASVLVQNDRRTPQGVRGLKCMKTDMMGFALTSHPARGAWIEISGISRGCV